MAGNSGKTNVYLEATSRRSSVLTGGVALYLKEGKILRKNTELQWSCSSDNQGLNCKEQLGLFYLHTISTRSHLVHEAIRAKILRHFMCARSYEMGWSLTVICYTTSVTIANFKKINLPDAPGVYFFRDANNEILYIGKATILKDRVRSYFTKDLHKTRGLKLVSMLLNAHTVTCQKTDSVLEALLLETELIKKYKPVFNTKEKDNKSYNCVVITKEEFPRVLVLRTRNVLDEMKKNIKYTFGPFSSNQALKDSLKIIRPIFPYRDTCVPNSGKECFNAQIGLCPKVCSGMCSKEEYAQNIRNIVSFFKGNKEEVVRRLTKEMNSHAKVYAFEKAQVIKKTLFALSHIRDSSLIKYTHESSELNTSHLLRIEGYDVAHISGTSRGGVMVVLENGEPQKSEYRKFKLPEKINDDYAALREMLTRRFAHTEWTFPSLIVIDGGPGQMNIAKEVLVDYKLAIPLVSVVKNAAHKPDHFLGEHEFLKLYKQEILLTNSESHRFAMSYHTQLRNKNFLNVKDKIFKKKETK